MVQYTAISSLISCEGGMCMFTDFFTSKLTVADLFMLALTLLGAVFMVRMLALTVMVVFSPRKKKAIVRQNIRFGQCDKCGSLQTTLHAFKRKRKCKRSQQPQALPAKPKFRQEYVVVYRRCKVCRHSGIVGTVKEVVQAAAPP